MLEQLQVPYTLREIDLANKPPDFLAVSPSGKVPLLLDGALKLYESFVLNLYVAEKYGLQGALGDEPGERARQRLAMLQFDAVLVPAFFRSLREGAAFAPDGNFERELDELAATVAFTPMPSLLAFHVATFWLRFGWLREHAPVVARFEAHEALRRWLDDAAAQRSVAQTAPDRDETVRAMLARFGPAK